MSTFNKAIANIIKANENTAGLRVAAPVKNVLNNVVVGGIGALCDAYAGEADYEASLSDESSTARTLLTAECVTSLLFSAFRAPDDVIERVREAVRRFAGAEHVRGQSASGRAGLFLPTARIRTLYKQELPEGTRVAEQALVATAAFLEHVTNEVWCAGARATVAAGKKTVTLELLLEALNDDPESALSRMLCCFRTPPEAGRVE